MPIKPEPAALPAAAAPAAPPSTDDDPRPSARRPLPLRHRVVLIAAALVVGFATARHDRDGFDAAPVKIATPAAAAARAPAGALPAPADTPYFSESWVSPLAHVPAAHSSALCALPGGELLATWYGGTREGAADVAVYTARRAPGAAAWSQPQVAVDRTIAQDELDRVIKKVGNAVIFPDHSGTLWMVYVSVSVGGWSGSALNVKTSADNGRTWGPSRRLTISPFFNLSTLVRNKPIFASDGRIGLPVYHELALKFPQVLWLTPKPAGGMLEYRLRSLAAKTGLIQPSLVPLGGDRVLMMLRDRRRERRMHTAYSEDNGWTWSDAAPSNLPNPDSALDAVRLPDGRILAVYNHAHSGRENLRLAVSPDAGRTWRAGPVLEAAAGREFSYPYLVHDAAGRIHLTYTWQRERIKHVEFNVAWLDRQLGPDLAAQQ